MNMLIVYFVFLAAAAVSVDGRCNETTHKEDLCNLAVDDPGMIFTQVDKDGNGIIDNMEYQQGCEIGYQEEQFCVLDTREPLDVLDLGEYVSAVSSSVLSFYSQFDTNNDSVFEQHEIAAVFAKFYLDSSNLSAYLEGNNQTQMGVADVIVLIKQLPSEEFPCLPDHYCPKNSANFTSDFMSMDKDKDGYLSITEASRILNTRSWLFMRLKGFRLGHIKLQKWNKYFQQMKQFKTLFFTPMDTDNDGYWSRQEYLQVNNMYSNPVANLFEKYPMNVEDAYDALAGLSLIQVINNFYEADRNGDFELSTKELSDYLKVNGYQTNNVQSFLQDNGGSLNFTQFVHFADSLPSDLFPKVVVRNDHWGNSLTYNYDPGYYYYYYS